MINSGGPVADYSVMLYRTWVHLKRKHSKTNRWSHRVLPALPGLPRLLPPMLNLLLLRWLSSSPLSCFSTVTAATGSSPVFVHPCHILDELDGGVNKPASVAFPVSKSSFARKTPPFATSSPLFGMSAGPVHCVWQVTKIFIASLMNIE